MSFELKPISQEAIPAAIEKVRVYRGLNEPAEAESICLDILDAEPANQAALVLLILSRTDQFLEGMSPQKAFEPLTHLESEYERVYYTGIIRERSAKAIIQRGTPGAGYTAYEQLLLAMDCFAKAESLRPAGNDDAILRWNACVRLLASHRDLQPRPVDAVDPVMSE